MPDATPPLMHQGEARRATRGAAFTLGDHSIPSRAALDVLRKLDPVQVARNPVIFVTEVVSLLVTVLACFLGGVDPFGGFGRVLPVVIALVILQVLSSGLNLLGANQHLATAIWGLFLIGVMIVRFLVARWRPRPRKDS